MKNLKLMLMAAGCVLATTQAQAIVYTGSHAIGPGTINVSITTDGTLGVLSAGNVTAWSFTMNGTGGTATINNGNSNFTFLSGNAFQATAADIVFDYTAVGHMQWDNFGLSGDDAYCLDTPGAAFTCLATPPDEVMLINGSLDVVDRQGRFVLGRAGVVPEPASWALMISGFGLIGAAARRRARTTVAFA